MDELRALASLARRRVPAASWYEVLARLGDRAAAIAAAAAAAAGETLAADLEWIAASGTQLIDCASPGYPAQLAGLAGAPAVLYVRGDAAVLASRQVAIVGSRSPTTGGRDVAGAFAAGLARAGLTITSGLALGIDAASHAGAVRAGGLTVAVFGTGLDDVYPREHAALACAIVDRGGALVSELPPRSPPRRESFPRRNRLISGLALGVVVVEAAPESGSFRTANHARAQGRPVFAVPGSLHNPLARGCHRLIRDGARLVEGPDDVLQDLNIPHSKQRVASMPASRGAAGQLDKDCEILLDACGFDPISFDVLVERTGLPAGSVASLLLVLELAGRIEPHPGGRYGRTQQA